jgi:hypothetical protein
LRDVRWIPWSLIPCDEMILDTTPDATRLRWRVLAALSGEERLIQALELTDLVLRVRSDGQRELLRRQKMSDAPTASGPS